MTEIAAPPVVTKPRPVWVWVIFVFYVVSSVWGLALQCLMFLGLYSLPPEQQALIGDMSTAARLFAVGSGILNRVAATSLWRKCSPLPVGAIFSATRPIVNGVLDFCSVRLGARAAA